MTKSEHLRKSEIVAPGGRAYHLGLAPDELARNIFLVGDPARAARVAAQFDHVLHEVTNREYITYTGTYDGMPVSVIGTGIGTDNVEIAFVEAYVLNEFDLSSKTRIDGTPPMTMIRLGTSGGVQPDVRAGTLAIADYAIGLDTTSIYYEQAAPDDRSVVIELEARRLLNESVSPDSRFSGFINPYVSRANADVTNALETAADKLDVDFAKGITVSSPGFYGPSSRLIGGFQNTVPDIKLRLCLLYTSPSPRDL